MQLERTARPPGALGMQPESTIGALSDAELAHQEQRVIIAATYHLNLLDHGVVERINAKLRHIPGGFRIERFQGKPVLSWESKADDTAEILKIATHLRSLILMDVPDETLWDAFENLLRTASSPQFAALEQEGGRSKSTLQHIIDFGYFTHTEDLNHADRYFTLLLVLLHDMHKPENISSHLPENLQHDFSQDHAQLAAIYAAEVAEKLGLTPVQAEALSWIIRYHHLPEQIERGMITASEALALLPANSEVLEQVLPHFLRFISSDVLAAGHARFLGKNMTEAMGVAFVGAAEFGHAFRVFQTEIEQLSTALHRIVALCVGTLEQELVTAIHDEIHFWEQMMQLLLLGEQQPHSGSSHD